jgi:hypothetical protein
MTLKPEEQSESRIPYNFFKAAPLVASANFGIGFRSPVYIKAKEKAIPAAVIGGGLLAGYGLLSNLKKQRAVDGLRINKLKDKDDKAFASNYYNSPQYYADNLIREAASITGNPLLDSIPNNDPLDQLGQEKKPQAKYSRVPKTANFFDPVTMSAISLGSMGYGLYNKRRAANEQSDVYEAQKLAALDTIKDKNLRRALINKARGQTIDEETKNQMVDSALNGDIKGLLGTGLKNINWQGM